MVNVQGRWALITGQAEASVMRQRFSWPSKGVTLFYIVET